MKPHPSSAEVVVVGGGAIGLAIAWRAAAAGLDVVVADESPGKGASRVAAGLLAPITEAHYGEEVLLELNLVAARRYPAFVEELEASTGRDVGYRRSGTLIVARDADENAALEELFRFQRRLGLEVRRLRSADCHEVEPGLSPSVRGGILVEGDHQVDNRALAGALLEACRRSGVRHRPARVRAVEVSCGRATGVALADGSAVGSQVVVLAAGCWSGAIEGLPPDVLPPVRPVKGQLLHLFGRIGGELVATHNVRGLDGYIVPRSSGRVIVGGTVEERGFDTSVTAGAVYEVLRAAYELLPGIAELEFVEATAGLRPGTPDNAPLIGATSVEGVIVATGHYRNGILLAPVTADAIVEFVVTGRVPAAVEPFSPERFSRERVAP